MLFPLPFASVHRSSRVCWTCCTQCSVRSSPPPGPGLLAAVWPADDPDAVHAERVCECTVPSVYPHVYRKAKTCHCLLSTQSVSMLCVLCLPALPADSSTLRPTWGSRISLPFSLDVAADTLAPWRLAWMVCPMVVAVRHPALAHTHTPREITAGSTKDESGLACAHRGVTAVVYFPRPLNCVSRFLFPNLLQMAVDRLVAWHPL